MKVTKGSNTKMKTRTRSLLVALCVLALGVPLARAQSMFASLSGTVQDVQGAMVVEAGVTVRNEASGETRTATTNQSGYFSVPQLPAGSYQILVVAQGFSQYHGTGITLTGGASRSLNVTLKVGQTSETIEVRGNKEDLTPSFTGEKSYTISAADIQNLSLVSRDATEFVSLMPGAVMSANGAVNSQAFSGQTMGMNTSSSPLGNENVNGQAVDSTTDGGHTVDPGAVGNSVPVTANQDMIAELKLMTSNFGAENAKGPVVVNVVTQNGGSDFHGSLHLVARNHAMNAMEASEKQVGTTSKPNEHYYYPGGTIGGPVIIPHTGFNKNRDKLFFFEGYEYYAQVQDAGNAEAFVPTKAMLAGDFSAVGAYGPNVAGGSILSATPSQSNITAGLWGSSWRAFDSTKSVSGARLQGCVISPEGVLNSACLDPNAVSLLSIFMPSPTTPNGAPDANGFNYIQDITQPMNMDQNLVRVDWDLSNNTKLYVTENRSRQTATFPLGYWNQTASQNSVPLPTPGIGSDGTDFVNVNFMHVISPSMTTESRFSYIYENFPGNPADPAKMLRGSLPNFNLKGIWDQKTAPDIITWNNGSPNLGDVGHAYPLTCYKKIPAAGEDLTKVFGTHGLKFGAYWEWTLNVTTPWEVWSAFYYSNWYPAVSGNQYADMLMGVGQSGYTENAIPPSPPVTKATIFSFYAQDDWKVNRRLAVQYGMRFDHYGKPYSTPYGAAVWDPDGTLSPQNKYNNDPAAIGQNTGVSWHSLNSKVPLSGSPNSSLSFSPRVGGAYDVFGTGKTIVRGGFGQFRDFTMWSYGNAAATSEGSVAWTCNLNDPLCPSWEDVDLHNQGPAVFGKGLPQGGIPTPTGTDQPLNIATTNAKDKATQYTNTYSLSVDQKLPGKLQTEISYVGNSTHNIQTLMDANAIPIGKKLGFNCPGGVSNSTYCDYAFRPYQNYQTITDNETYGKARFDSLQVSVQRNTGFLTLMVNYTFSKALGEGMLGGDNTEGYPDHGVEEFYGVLQMNRPNVLSTAYVVHMPKIRRGNSLVKGVLDGWDLSGITQIESGANLTSGTGGWNFAYSPVSDPQATQDSDKGKYDSAHLLGTDSIRLMPLLTCNPRHGNPKGTYLNWNCFKVPAGNGVNGTTKMPYIPGPMFWKSDLTVQKSFNVHEHQNLLFRAAGFNFLNHPLLSFASGDLNLEANNLAYNPEDGTEINNNPNFGKALWHMGHRIMELEVKYTF